LVEGSRPPGASSAGRPATIEDTVRLEDTVMDMCAT